MAKALLFLLVLTTPAAAETTPPTQRVAAVRTLGDDGSLAAAVGQSGFFRPGSTSAEGWRGEVGPDAH